MPTPLGKLTHPFLLKGELDGRLKKSYYKTVTGFRSPLGTARPFFQVKK